MHIYVQIYEYNLLNPFLSFDGMLNSVSLWDSLRGSTATWYLISLLSAPEAFHFNISGPSPLPNTPFYPFAMLHGATAYQDASV